MDAAFDTRTEKDELVLDFYLYETTASKLGHHFSHRARD
jgi:hypothetical protein